MDFESATPSAVKSIKQRDLLNTWIRLYVRHQRLPRLADYAPERIEDEKLDLIYYTVDASLAPPRLTILSENTRMAAAYGHTGKGQRLEDFLGPLPRPPGDAGLSGMRPARAAGVHDRAYRRRPWPHRRLSSGYCCRSRTAMRVTDIVASLKTISEDGNFEIRNLIRGDSNLPIPKLRTVIDRELVHRMPGRAVADDVIEIE